MKINTTLDVNVVAHESDDEVTALIDLEAPAAVKGEQRVPSSLVIVLDRSGSMHGAPLEGAKRAIIALVQRLAPTDNFGLVTFDDQAQVVVVAGPLTDKAEIVGRISRVRSGGSTDLGAGYLRGLQEIKRVSTGSAAGSTGGTLLVVSDGHVNQGMRDVDEFASVTAKAYTDRIVTSTLGYGQGYDETLLAAIARSGSGNHVFADNPDSAGAAIAAEVDGLLEKVAQAVSLTVKFEPTVEMIRLYNDLPAQQIGDGQVMIELGDLYADEQRKLLIKFNVPALRELGLARIATLELQYVEVPGLLDHLVSTPVTVNVVPGDEAAQRIPHPTVQSEVLFQEAQDAKKKASEAFETGDLASGRDFLDRADEQLRIAIDIAPEDVRASIDDERRQVQDMKGMSLETGASYMSKLTRDSYHRQNRKRGRRPRPTGPGSTDTSGS